MCKPQQRYKVSIRNQKPRYANVRAGRVARHQLANAVARLAQSAERKALNLVVVGSSPTVGAMFDIWVWQRFADSGRRAPLHPGSSRWT